MPVEDHVDRFLRERADRVLVRVAAARIAVHQADANAVDREDLLAPEPAPDVFGVVVAGDGIERRDRFEQLDRQRVREVTEVEDAADPRGPQTVFERARQRAPEAR